MWFSDCTFLPQQCCGAIGCVDYNSQSGRNAYSDYIAVCGDAPVYCTSQANCSYNAATGTCYVDYNNGTDTAAGYATATPAVDMTTDHAPSTSTATPAVDMTTDYAPSTSTATPAVDMTTDHAPSTSTANPAVDMTTDYAPSTATASPAVDITTDHAPSTATVEPPCEYCSASSTPGTIF